MAPSSIQWQWRGWPELRQWYTRYRVFSTFWMAYVIVKYSFRDELSALLELMFHPDKPAFCYLLGRFVIEEEFKRITAILFATFHLSWRYVQYTRHNPHRMSLVYFLMLDDRDINTYYSLLSHPSPQQEGGVTTAFRRRRQPRPLASAPLLGSEARPPGAPMEERVRMMHDIMSYRVDYKHVQVCRLRPNRTPEACRLLRNTLVVIFLLTMFVFMVAGTIITSVILIICLNPAHMLTSYPGCNPELERQVRSGQRPLDPSGFSFSEHTVVALPADIMENWILWTDSGLVCMLSPGFTFLLNQDLIIYWAHLHDKIELVLQVVRDINLEIGCSAQRERQLWIDELVLDLQMQIQDIIKQIKQADEFITDAMSSFLFIWFSSFGYFIYRSTTVRDGQLPLTLLLTLLLMGSVVTIYSVSLLTLHRRIHRSYTLICSLMAHDRSQYKRNFCSVLEYFVQERTTFTVFRFKKLTATSYLTIVGWSVSCYFLLSKIH